jgi:hypothetical protein
MGAVGVVGIAASGVFDFASVAGSPPFEEPDAEATGAEDDASFTSPFESTTAGGDPASALFIVEGDFTTVDVSLVLGASSSTTAGFSAPFGESGIAVGTNDPTTARASLPASASALFNSA